MKDHPSLILVAPDGRRVVFPPLPETLVRGRTADAHGERLELVTHLDDRLGDERGTTAEMIWALSTLSEEVSELHWGKRRFRGTLAALTVTETGFNEELEPIAAMVQLAFDVSPDEEQTVSVTVAGERWQHVQDLEGAGPHDRVYELRVGDDGSFQIRFGDGQRGARPPAGDVLVRARYRVGGGSTSR
jgi:hypothetical protein